METLAIEVSTSFAVWWTLGAAAGGALIFWLVMPSVIMWWREVVFSTMLGVERLLYVTGGLAIVAAIIGLAVWVA